MSSRKLADCSVEAAASFAEFELMLKAAGIEFVRACTYRSREEQAKLYAQGRTAPGKIATHAQPGESRHNDVRHGQPASNAADYYPLINGKLAGDETDEELLLWSRMGSYALSCGLIWGGKWKKKKIDRPHFELPIKLQPD